MAIEGRLFSVAHRKALSDSWARTKELRRVTLRRGWEKRRLTYGPAIPMSRKEINHRYTQSHKNELRGKLRTWRCENLGMAHMQNKRNRARRRGALGRFTAVEWYFLVALFYNRCAYCWRRKKLEADHVIPVSKGGTNFIENILPCCRSCNSRKGDRLCSDGE